MKTEILFITCIVLFLVIIISLATNFFKVNEGLTTAEPPATPAVIKMNYQPTVTAQQINAASNSLLNTLNIGTNKADYEDIINALLSYYDNLSLYTIINSTKLPNSTYNLQQLYSQKVLRDALQDSLEYLKSA